MSLGGMTVVTVGGVLDRAGDFATFFDGPFDSGDHLLTMISLIADWSGPFPSMEAAQIAAKDFALGEVLYMATGKCSYQRATHIQYVGIATDLKSRFNDPNHHIRKINKECEIWIGEIASHSVAGRKSASHPVRHSLAVCLAEWLLAYFLEIPLNKYLRTTPPPDSVVIFNRWFHCDFETRYTKRGHNEWPDFIEYDKDYGHASIVWFGSPPRRRRLSITEIQGLALSS